MARQPGELLPGTLEMLVLRTLTVDRVHGYAIAQHISRTSQDVLKIEKGSLHPALERLEPNGWVTSKLGGDAHRSARALLYNYCVRTERVLGTEISSFEEIVAAIARVLKPS